MGILISFDYPTAKVYYNQQIGYTYFLLYYDDCDDDISGIHDLLQGKREIFWVIVCSRIMYFNGLVLSSRSIKKTSILGISKMGNQIVRCGLEQTLTEQKTVAETCTYEEDVIDTLSTDLCVKDPLKMFLQRIPPKVKTFTEIPQKHSTEKAELEEEVFSRVIQKSMKTVKSLTVRSLASFHVDEKEHDSNLLELVQEQIEKIIKEKGENGLKNVRESIDRGQLFKRLNINLASFIRTKGENVKDYYEFKECIGEGGYGKVFRVICKRTKEIRAVKVLKRREGMKERDKASFLAEFELLSTLDHPNIVKLYQIYYHKGHYYVVMEFCQGGSLIDIMKKNKHFSEQSVAHIMKQLLSALAYLHSMNIVHRDIKLDNIVALSEDSDGFISIKIIDFGTATKVSAFRTKGKICGTRSYMAPEVFQGKVNVKSDVWSSGVFLYLLFMGKFPFMANSLLQMQNTVNSTVVTFASSEWSSVSKQAKKLLMGMLEKNPERRLSAADALNLPWFSKANHSETNITYEECNLKNLEHYQRGNNFIAVIENYLCLRQISQHERDRLGKLFRQIDSNNDGVISQRELVLICQEHYGDDTENEVKKILKEIDQNDSGKIDFNQFLLAMYSRKKLFLQSSLLQAFKFYDLDGDGYLQRAELVELLSGCDRGEVEYLLEQLDTDKDDKVSMNEFLAYINKNSNDQFL